MSAIFKPDITRTPAPDWDDDRLMAEIGRGNQQAAQILIDRHLSYVLKICTSKLGSGQDGEDAAQDVFASVWKNAAHWQSGRAKVTTWLYRIAVNRCIDILRKKRPQSGLDEIAEPEDDAESAEALMQAADRNRIIRSALVELGHRAGLLSRDGPARSGRNNGYFPRRAGICFTSRASAPA